MTHTDLSFRQWLKRLRAAQDLTQDALAEQVGCAAQTIRMFEIGKRRPSRDLAERLADVLHVPPQERADFIRQARTGVGVAPPDASTRGVSGGATRKRAGEQVSDNAADTSSTAVQAARQSEPVGQGTPILATKLYIPRPRADLTLRPRLLARLDAGLAGNLTLIAAPAGWGKTTLLADWLRRANHRRKAAWLTLEVGDAEPTLFLRYLIAAVQTIAPELGTTTTNLLRAAHIPSLETVMPLLVNDLVQLPEPSILILDDYHVINTPVVHQALVFLLEHLPPQLHLVIATRADPPLPLSRFRARGLLTELRANDLRFTSEEAAIFFREVMGMTLTVDEVAALEARTEGWIAGIQLAALSLRDQPGNQRAQFIDAFTGSHRFVVDYLVDEVLTRQPSHIQAFLLQTSILERLSGPLCDAVVLAEASVPAAGSGMAVPADSQLLLGELERANLFIVPLDDARRWYRYHQLFAHVLRERLTSGASAEAVATLHRRASAWFQAQDMSVEAVSHALAGHDWERVATLIEADGRTLLVNGQIHSVLGWLDALPDPFVRAHPYLLHLRALGLFFVNQLAAAERCLETIEVELSTGIPDDRSRTILAYASLLRATIARFRGDFTRCVPLAHQALATMPPADIPRRLSAQMILASAVVASGDVSLASERQLLEAVRSARSSTDKSTLLNGIVNLGMLQRRRGRLRAAAATYREAVQLAPAPGELQVLGNGAAYYFGLGDVLREWNDFDAAELSLLQGRDMVLGALVAEADSIGAGYIALARLQMARGDWRAADATLEQLGTVARQRNFEDHLLARVDAARAHLALLEGKIAQAVQWADMSGLRTTDVLRHHRESEYVALARVRIAQGRATPTSPALRGVLTLLGRLVSLAEAGSRIESVIEVLILYALALHAQGDLHGALARLERALTFAAAEGYVRVFVDEGLPMAALLGHALRSSGWGAKSTNQDDVRAYATMLVTVFHTEGIEPMLGPVPPNPNVELLTPRELEVLRLLAAGHSTHAIAQELVVAPGTVKRHVNNILSKLQVQSRLEAVARARTLNLL